MRITRLIKCNCGMDNCSLGVKVTEADIALENNVLHNGLICLNDNTRLDLIYELANSMPHKEMKISYKGKL